MKNRSDVINFILKIERNFNVNYWLIGGVKIWPFLRIKLFFSLINIIENDQLSLEIKREKFNNKYLEIFLSILKFPFLILFFSKLKKKKFLFFGTHSHRVLFKGEFFNRFFDTIIDQLGIKNSSYIFDFNTFIVNQPIRNKKINYDLHYYSLIFFNLYKIKLKITGNIHEVELLGYDKFLMFLCENSITSQLKFKFEKSLLSIIFTDILIHEKFFEKLLNIVKPEKIFLLSYYSKHLYSLNIACFKKGIETIDFQHGPNTNLHAPYGKWTNVPNNGYEMLPKTFWSWDDKSFKITNEWTSKNSYHKSIVYGNPWLDYFNLNSIDFSFKENGFILYTLQPLSLDVLFPIELLKIINSSNKKWYIRLHPLQYHNKEKLIGLFKKENILDKIEINKASSIPLPILLSNCLIHLSNYSGCTIEAAIMGKYSLLFHDYGKSIFDELILENKANFFDLKHSSINEFENLLLDINVFSKEVHTKSFYDYFKSIS